MRTIAAQKREKERIRQSKRRAERVASRECYHCGIQLPQDYDRKLCPDCRVKMNAYFRERYKWRKLSGACVLCGRIAREDRVLCEKCAAQQSETARARKAARDGT